MSPVITIGGGRVLDAGEPAIRIDRDQRLPFCKPIASATPSEALLARINRRWIFGLTAGRGSGGDRLACRGAYSNSRAELNRHR